MKMQGWQMSVPNHKDMNADILYDRRPWDAPFFQVGATFASPQDEHYYGLGQNQEGYLDRRGHAVRCAHDYNAPAGQSVCVPFVVTNKGYGIVLGTILRRRRLHSGSTIRRGGRRMWGRGFRSS